MKALLRKEMTLHRQRQQTEAGASTTAYVPPLDLTVIAVPEVTYSPPSPFSPSPPHPSSPPLLSTTTSLPVLPFSSELPPWSPTPHASFESSPLVSPPGAASSPQAYHKLQEEGGTACPSSSPPPYFSPLFPIPLSGEADFPLRKSPSPMSFAPLVSTFSSSPSASATVSSSPLGSPLLSSPSSSPSMASPSLMSPRKT